MECIKRKAASATWVGGVAENLTGSRGDDGNHIWRHFPIDYYIALRLRDNPST